MELRPTPSLVFGSSIPSSPDISPSRSCSRHRGHSSLRCSELASLLLLNLVPMSLAVASFDSIPTSKGSLCSVLLLFQSPDPIFPQHKSQSFCSVWRLGCSAWLFTKSPSTPENSKYPTTSPRKSSTNTPSSETPARVVPSATYCHKAFYISSFLHVRHTENTPHPNLFGAGFIEVSLEPFLSTFALVTVLVLTCIGSDELLLDCHRF